MEAKQDRKSSSKINLNNIVQPLLVDRYQLSMCFAYWSDKIHEKNAVFELYFRKNPFRGEFTIFAGLSDCLKFIKDYTFKSSDIEYLKNLHGYSHIPADFWEYLMSISTKEVKVYGMYEGSVCFPNTPIMRIEGPIAILQLLETPLLTLTNYASLIATNAARYRIALNSSKSKNQPCKLLEFGLRRAQGPDGGYSASRYVHLGGFDATSNLLAGKEFDIPTCGTMGHSFVISYFGTEPICESSTSNHKFIYNKRTDKLENFTMQCFENKKKLAKSVFHNIHESTEKSELKAFIAFASSFPNSFLALIDSYDCLKSGLINFSIVAVTLIDFGYSPIGVRIDSGDLAYLSKCAHQLFVDIARIENIEAFKSLEIVASNDINEETITSLNDQDHNITSMGIGTHLVTCQNQPALGIVYKLVESDNVPCMKLSSVPEKITMPGRKALYRLFGREGHPLLDLMSTHDEDPPISGQRILCYHPYIAEKRTYVTPARVEPLLIEWWDGNMKKEPLNLEHSRNKCIQDLANLTDDIKRSLNPTPYKVSVTGNLLNLINRLKIELTPIGELC